MVKAMKEDVKKAVTKISLLKKRSNADNAIDMEPYSKKPSERLTSLRVWEEMNMPFLPLIDEADSEIFTARLQSLIDQRNNQENRRYRISISVGCSCYDPEHPCSINELIASADK